MEIDNLELVRSLLIDNQEYFYVLSIMTRNKDFGNSLPEKKQKNRLIKEYYISNVEYLESKYSEIKSLCKLFNARAYINLNRKRKSDLGLEILEQTVKKIKSAAKTF